MSELAFRPAVRSAIKPLIGLLGVSGGGKTLTGLLLARGIAGPNGRIGIIDTENGRGLAFVGMVPGGYEHMDLQPPFSPVRYSTALDEAERAGLDCLVVDSATHEWTGPGGYLELKEQALDKMAGNDWAKRERCVLAAAAREKPAHNRFVDRIQRCRMPVILCFRGKEKVKMEKNAQNKTTIEKETHLSAIQDSGLIFEMLLAGEVNSRPDQDGIPVGGFFTCTKYTVPDLRELLPGPDEQLGIKHGEAIAKWAAGGSVTKPLAQKAKPSPLKTELWKLTESIHGNDRTKGAEMVEQYLRDARMMKADETLGTLTEDRLGDIVAEVKEQLEASRA